MSSGRTPNSSVASSQHHACCFGFFRSKKKQHSPTADFTSPATSELATLSASEYSSALAEKDMTEQSESPMHGSKQSLTPAQPIVLELISAKNVAASNTLIAPTAANISPPSGHSATACAGLKKKSLIPLDEIHFGKLLGSGGFSQVFKATIGDDVFAVKVAYASDRVNYEEFSYEVKIMELLTAKKAPHVVRYYGYNVTLEKEQPHAMSIIMQYLPGGNLRTYIKTHTQSEFPWAQRFEILKQVIGAVEFLHRYKIIHRDIKAENVLLNDNGDAVLGDFGLSLYNEDDGITNGTVPWMAPELFFSQVRNTSKVDIYAFAILMWEVGHMLFPFAHISDSEVREKVCAGTRPTVTITKQPKFVALMEWCWQAKSNHRPTAKQVCNEFEILTNPERVSHYRP